MIATFRDIDMAALGRFCTRMFNEHLDRIRTGDWSTSCSYWPIPCRCWWPDN
jgi:hypothetical protein